MSSSGRYATARIANFIWAVAEPQCPGLLGGYAETPKGLGSRSTAQSRRTLTSPGHQSLEEGISTGGRGLASPASASRGSPSGRFRVRAGETSSSRAAQPRVVIAANLAAVASGLSAIWASLDVFDGVVYGDWGRRWCTGCRSQSHRSALNQLSSSSEWRGSSRLLTALERTEWGPRMLSTLAVMATVSALVLRAAIPPPGDHLDYEVSEPRNRSCRHSRWIAYAIIAFSVARRDEPGRNANLRGRHATRARSRQSVTRMAWR